MKGREGHRMLVYSACVSGGLLWVLFGLGGCQPQSTSGPQDAILWLDIPQPTASLSAQESVQDTENLAFALAEAEADWRIYTQTLTATREAIEEAVVMVQEQRENFDFALDRYETLMPLVETGALDPLAASQIQSAYIAARASLAQAKFLLGQARRDFGSEEYRRRELARLQRRLETLREAVTAETNSSALGESAIADNEVSESSTPMPPGILDVPFVEVFLDKKEPELQQNSVAWVRLPLSEKASDTTFAFRVVRIEEIVDEENPQGFAPVRVWLQPDAGWKPPVRFVGRRAVPVEVSWTSSGTH